MLESKRKAIIFITLSILLAILAGIMFLQKVKALNTQLGDTTPVFVAKTDIPSRELIKPNQVKTIEIPNKYITDKHIIDKDKLVNKVSIIPLSPDDIITTSMLKEASMVRDQNNRIVSVMTSEKVTFDQALTSLDRVDIIVSHKFEDKPKTELFMSDVLVSGIYTSKDETKFKGVTLEVSAEDAPKFIHMQNYADSVRILKANVGKEKDIQEKKETKPDEKQAPAPKAPEKTPASEPKPATTPAPAPKKQ
jgi:Flp pilus assembly protein CpaB